MPSEVPPQYKQISTITDLKGKIDGMDPYSGSSIIGVVNALQPGEVEWSIMFGNDSTIFDFVQFLPALTLPYGWLVAAKRPSDTVPNGFDITTSGHFNATVELSYDGGQKLLVWHESRGLSESEAGLITFVIQVSGTRPPTLNAESVLLPLSVTLSQPSMGILEGSVVTSAINATIRIHYPVSSSSTLIHSIQLNLLHTPILPTDMGVSFFSRADIQPVVANFSGNVNGDINNKTLATVQITAAVDSETDVVSWIIRSLEGDIQDGYLALLPLIVVPAGWFTANKEPDYLSNGLEVSRDGNFTSTLTLSSATGEELAISLSTTGPPSHAPGQYEYTVYLDGEINPEIDTFEVVTSPIHLTSQGVGLVSGRYIRGDVNLTMEIYYSGDETPFPTGALVELVTEAISRPYKVTQSIIQYRVRTKIRFQSITTLLGSISDMKLPDPISPTQIVATIDSSQPGKLDWSVTFGTGSSLSSYLPLLPAITLPYSWLFAMQTPQEISNGVELTATGRFNATVLLDFGNDVRVSLEHVSEGLSQMTDGQLQFSIQVTGSNPPDIDSSDLFLPANFDLYQQSIGTFQANASSESLVVSLTINYQQLDGAPTFLQPLLRLRLQHGSITSTDAQLIFSSLSSLSRIIRQIDATVDGSDDGSPLPSAQLTGSVHPNINGQVSWTLSTVGGIQAGDYIRLLPVIVLPAGWLTASKSPAELRNGLEVSIDGTFSATLSLAFPDNVRLGIDLSSLGAAVDRPGTFLYRYSISGSLPPDFDALQLLSAPISLVQTSQDRISGLSVASDNVTLSLSISYPGQAPAIPDGVSLSFLQNPTQAPTATSTDSVGYTVQSVLSLPSVEELRGDLNGARLPSPISPTQIVATVDRSQSGKLDWSVTFGTGSSLSTYLSLLPAITLPYGWLIAMQTPQEVNNGVELTATGRFNATVLLDFGNDVRVSLEHVSEGLSQMTDGQLQFSIQVTGSDLPDVDSSDLFLPANFDLYQQSIGTFQANASSESLVVSLTINYQQLDGAPTFLQPLLRLGLQHGSITSTDAQLTFSSLSSLSRVVRQIDATVDGSVDGSPLPSAQLTGSVHPNINGQVSWTLSTVGGIQAGDYIRLLPVIVLPAGWLTASQSPVELRNGLEVSIDGTFTATLSLAFPDNVRLGIDLSSLGAAVDRPGTFLYRYSISGSLPPDFDVLKHLSAPISLIQTSQGRISGLSVASDNVSLSLSISYPGQAPAIPDGASLSFLQNPTQAPTATSTDSVGYTVLSVLTLPSVEELRGDLSGARLSSPISPTQIVATVDRSQSGKLDWSVTFGTGSSLSTYLPLLPAITLPYGWLIAMQTPQEVNNGMELTATGRFNATVLLDFGNDVRVSLEHVSEGLSQMTDGQLQFSIQVTGSDLPDIDSSDLFLPANFDLYQQSIGTFQANASSESLVVSLTINYQQLDGSPTFLQPLLRLGLQHGSITSTDAQLTFSSLSSLSRVVRQIDATVDGSVDGSPLPSAQLTGSVHPNINGQVSWTLSTVGGIQAGDYIRLLPVIVLPAGWLTASQSPVELRNGLEVSIDGTFSATLSLAFPDNVRLGIDLSSLGAAVDRPGTFLYRYSISGSLPPDFDVLKHLSAPISLVQTSQGRISGLSVASDNVTLSLSISYPGQAPAIPDGASLSFLQNPIQAPTATSTDSVGYTVQSVLSLPSVEELRGDLSGARLPSPISPTQIVATVDRSQSGKLDWSVTFGNGSSLSTYLPLLPAITLPYGWLIAMQTPQEVNNGVELTATGRFNATVLLDFGNDVRVSLEHVSEGLSQMTDGQLQFSIQVTGSDLPDIDSSDLFLPANFDLYQQSIGTFQANASSESLVVSLTIDYQQLDGAPTFLQPLIRLRLQHGSITSTDAQLTFSSLSSLSRIIRQIDATVDGSVDGSPLPSAQLTGSVHPNINGQVSWTLSTVGGIQAGDYIRLLPVIVLPAGWLTASQSPVELSNGLEVSIDGTFSATLSLAFPDNVRLGIDLSSLGAAVDRPGTFLYRYSISGSLPPDFDALQLLSAQISLVQTSQGRISGLSVASDNVTLSLSIRYPGQSPAIPDGASLSFLQNPIQPPTPTSTDSVGYTVQSVLTLPSVEELRGDLNGARLASPISPTQIVATVDRSQSGKLDWSVTFGTGSSLSTYLPLLPAITLPYGWLIAMQTPQEVNNGVELTATGRFNATVLLDFGNDVRVSLEHVSEGLSQMTDGQLQFSIQVTGSDLPDVDSSDLFLPANFDLYQQSIGTFQANASSESLVVSLTINYQQLDGAPNFLQPLLRLRLQHGSITSTDAQLTFSSLSGLSRIIRQIDATVDGSVDGSPLPSAQLTGSVHPNINGQVSWTLSTVGGIQAGDYIRLLPVIVLPAGWLTASQIPAELRNGLEVSIDGTFTATLSLAFPDNVRLGIDLSSLGAAVDRPGTFLYRYSISGSLPPDFDALQLFSGPISLIQTSQGRISGLSVTSDNVTLSLSIRYRGQSPAIPDGASLSFLQNPIQAPKATSIDSVGYTVQSVLILPSVEELRGDLNGARLPSPISQTHIVATVDRSQSGKLDWSVTFGNGSSLSTYLPLLPAITLPYGWLIAMQTPQEVNNGVELTATGRFNATVLLDFGNDVQVSLEHVSEGLSQMTDGQLQFSIQVTGSDLPDIDSSDLFLPANFDLYQQSIGTFQANASSESLVVSLTINYQQLDGSPTFLQPLLRLGLQHGSITSTDAQLTFSSLSSLSRVVRQIDATVDGSVDGSPLPSAQLTGSVHPNINGQVSWTLSTVGGIQAGDYIRLLPVIVLPAGWLTASQSPVELRNGLEVSIDGTFSATLSLAFPDNVRLGIDLSSLGAAVDRPGTFLYRYSISGSLPPDFDALQLLSAPISLVQTSQGRISGLSVASDNVTLSLSISYPGQSPAIPDGASLSFLQNPTQAPTATSTDSVGYTVLSVLTLPSVEELRGHLNGARLPSPISPTQIVATVDRSQSGKLDWSVTFGTGSSLSAYLPLLPAITLPYGWLIAMQTPQEVNNGVELTATGRFNATVLLYFGNDVRVSLEHVSEGLSQMTDGQLQFSIQVTGSDLPDIDSSDLFLPANFDLYQQSIGTFQANASSESLVVSLTINYQQLDGSPTFLQPLLRLGLQHGSITSTDAQLTFSSLSSLSRVVRQIDATVDGSVDGSPLPSAQLTGSVHPNINGQVSWTLSTVGGIQAGDYIRLLPVIVLPAGWLTASQSPVELRNGLEVSIDGTFSATLSLAFPDNVRLGIDLSSLGAAVDRPGTFLYRYSISGSLPPDFDALQLLSAPISLVQTSQGRISGLSVASDNVTLSLSISYPGQAPAIPDGASLSFLQNPTQAPTATSTDSVGYTVLSVLTLPSVEELRGHLNGARLPSPISPTQIVATVDRSQSGKLDWSVTFGTGSSLSAYLPLLPAITLPYGWLIAMQTPQEVNNGVELTATGRFNATVLLYFGNDVRVSLEHVSEGLSQMTDGQLQFSIQVTGSDLPDVDSSDLFLPANFDLYQQSIGTFQANASSESLVVSLTINYQQLDGSPTFLQPLLRLGLQHGSITSTDAQLTFSSLSSLSRVVRQIDATVDGSVDGSPLPSAQLTGSVHPNINGQVSWTLSTVGGIQAGDYIRLLPVIVLPAGWLTASQSPVELRNGLEVSIDGTFSATLSLAFPDNVRLGIDLSSLGAAVDRPGTFLYRYSISGSLPPDFDVLKHLSAPISLVQTSQGRISGLSVASDNVTLSLSISYPGQAPAIPDGASLSFLQNPIQAPTATSTDSVGYTVQSVLSLPSVEELRGDLSGARLPSPISPTQIVATVDRSQSGKLDWSVTFGNGSSLSTYLPLLPAIALPYGWLIAMQTPQEVNNGVELTATGRFNATVLLDFGNDVRVSLEHVSEGLSQMTDGQLQFSIQVTGSDLPDVDSSDLFLPANFDLYQQSIGTFQANASSESLVVSLTIDYQQLDGAPTFLQPLIRLRLQHGSITSTDAQLTFSSLSSLSRIIRQIDATVDGSVDGSPLPSAQLTGSVHPNINGQVSWTLSTVGGIQAGDYIRLLPVIVLPAGWLTASQIPAELRNGLEVSIDGTFTATLSLAFPDNVRLGIDLSSLGAAVDRPGTFLYRYSISGSLPPDFDALQLLSAQISLVQTSQGRISGLSFASDNVTLSLSISYPGQSPAIPDGVSLSFLQNPIQAPKATSTDSVGYTVQSVLTLPSVEELRGDLNGARLPSPISLTQIVATVDRSQPGKLDWSVSFGNGSSLSTYLPLLPAITLPYGWLFAMQTPQEVSNGLELTDMGRFNSTIVLTFVSGRKVTLEHISDGMDSTRLGLLHFTINVYGFYQPQIDTTEELLPTTFPLFQPMPGMLTSNASTPGVSLQLDIRYRPQEDGPPTIVPSILALTLRHGIVISNSTSLSFTADTTLRRHLTRIAGSAGGTLNRITLPLVNITGELVADTDGRLQWILRTEEGEEARVYLPILSAILIPAGWLTAAQEPDTLSNGLEVSSDGTFNATVVLTFTSGEILHVTISSVPLTEPSVWSYSVTISDSIPTDFDFNQLVRLLSSISFSQPSSGLILGSSSTESVSLEVDISYPGQQRAIPFRSTVNLLMSFPQGPPTNPNFYSLVLVVDSHLEIPSISTSPSPTISLLLSSTLSDVVVLPTPASSFSIFPTSATSQIIVTTPTPTMRGTYNYVLPVIPYSW